MQEGPITTHLVHSMLNRDHKSLRKEPVLKMEYEEYNPPNYQNEMKDRIRSRSFYIQKSNYNELIGRKQVRNNIVHRSVENSQPSREAAKIFVEFQTISKAKLKKDSQKAKICSSEYYTIMTNSMNKYISKVQKGKQKKIQKCQQIRQFGINIQSIKTVDETEDRFAPQIKRKGNSLSSSKKKNNNSHFVQKMDNSVPNVQIKKQSFFQGQKSDNHLTKASSVNEDIQKNFINSISVSTSLKKAKYFKKIIKAEKEENTVGKKLNKMLGAFSVILNSYGVRIDRTQVKQNQDLLKSKKSEKYTYYVGKGNNKNLIISLLKKRWWWAEADDLASANFVWTQTKVTTVLQKQSSMFYSELDGPDPEVFKSLKEKNIETIAPFHNFFHKKFSQRFYHKLSDRDERRYLRPMKTPVVLHNHYEANYMLGNKKALFYNICEYKQFKGEDPFDFMPLTYHIEKLNSKSFKLFQKKAKQSKNMVWIVKPGQNTNRGKGIFVSDSIEKIKRVIQKDNSHTFIIQKYLKNNLTFQRRKFDIRTYLLMVSIGGVKKFYWYSQGYLRTSSQIYRLDDLDDPFIHLTNDAIQVNGDNYGKFQKGNKVTYHQFQRYLDLNFPNQKYSVPGLVEKMKNIAKQVVNATYFKIDPCRKQCSFQLFGLDFLIDSNFKPWLLEVNTNPCLELSGPVLERLIPPMVENLFRIAIDPIFQPSHNDPPRNLACYIPENILQRTRFQLIFDSMYDGNHIWEQFALEKNQNKVYEDENDEFQSDGDLIRIVD